MIFEIVIVYLCMLFRFMKVMYFCFNDLKIIFFDYDYGCIDYFFCMFVEIFM